MDKLDELLKDLPEEQREAIKTFGSTMYNKGIRIGAYTISLKILSILRTEPNPAKAKAQVIKFIKQNKDVQQKETEDNEIHD